MAKRKNKQKQTPAPNFYCFAEGSYGGFDLDFCDRKDARYVDIDSFNRMAGELGRLRNEVGTLRKGLLAEGSPKLMLLTAKNTVQTHGGLSEEYDYRIYLGKVFLRRFSTRGNFQDGSFGTRAQSAALQYVKALSKELKTPYYLENV